MAYLNTKKVQFSIIILSLSAFTLIFSGCSKTQSTENIVRPVKVDTVYIRNEITRDYSGVVNAVNYVKMTFRVSGQIIKLNVVEGQKVKKGEVIAQIDPREINLQLEAAKADYETSKAQLERNQRLLQHQAVSKQEYEIAQSQYQQSKSNYEAQQNNIYDTYLRAPFDGSIVKLDVENYQRVMAGVTIGTLVNSHNLEVYFTVPDNTLSLIEKGHNKFTVEFEVYKGIKFDAVLKEYVEMSPDGSGIPVFLTITDPRFKIDEYDIKPGFSCNVTMKVQIDNKDSEFPYVPLTAILGSPDTNSKNVWVYNPSTSTVNLTPVTTGSLLDENNILITNGLKKGDIVVTAGVTQITNGEKVKVLQ